jgi:hypothetical protein
MPITHTPNLILGPWNVEYIQGSINTFHLWDENDNFPPNAERDGAAYARVMSAAPELLAALEAIVLWYEYIVLWGDGNLPGDTVDAARAAIAKAKAKGET